MNHLQAFGTPAWIEQAWLARYLDGLMTADEQTAFETHALGRPELLEAIAADTALRDALDAWSEKAGDAATIVPTPTPTPTPTPRVAVGRPTTRRVASWMAVAAAVAMALVTGRQLAPGASEPEMAFAPQRIVYDSYRGGRGDPVVTQGTGGASFYIADIAVPLHARASAIRAIDGDRVHDVPAPDTSSDGFITLALPEAWRGRLVLDIDLVDDETGKPATPIRIDL